MVVCLSESRQKTIELKIKVRKTLIEMEFDMLRKVQAQIKTPTQFKDDAKFVFLKNLILMRNRMAKFSYRSEYFR